MSGNLDVAVLRVKVFGFGNFSPSKHLSSRAPSSGHYRIETQEDLRYEKDDLDVADSRSLGMLSTKRREDCFWCLYQ